MRFARTPLPIFALAFVCAFALGLGNAFAAGTLTFAKKEIQEANGGWHLMMTIVYGGKPNTPHVPMQFTFTPTAILENYLDDAHGEKPQKRKIPLVGQTPLHESVDVDFADSRGKLYDRTKFDFTITRSHNFSAGDYSVAVHRPDGAQVGATQTIVLLGDNPVIDRRSISFVASGPKKDKPAAPAASGGAPDNKTASGEGDQASGATDTSAASTPPAEEPPAEPPGKVPPSSRGCGCRAVGSASVGPLGLATIALGALVVLRLRRRSRRPRGATGRID
ncbi:MAG TPA: hypothetical protein VF881_15465 [Polyangiaceae bacterium]